MELQKCNKLINFSGTIENDLKPRLETFLKGKGWG
jgi:hypothetical protein